MMKRIMRVVLSAMMVFSVISVNVHAEEENVELSQLTYGKFFYKLSNGEITVTGFDKTDNSNLEIPNQIDGYSVTAIGDKAFEDCHITSVTIPNTVKTIGYNAFSDCRNLTSVTIEDGVETIGDSAFSYCDELQSISLPKSVNSIDGYCFRGC